jgi:hypothetical protein
MVYLIAQYYKIKYDDKGVKDRQKEIDKCFLTNLENSSIKEVHWLAESQEDIDYYRSINFNLNYKKLKIFLIGERMTYKLMFQHANKELKGKNCIYLHADMELDQKFPEVQEKSLLQHVYMITPCNKKKCKNNINCGCTRTFMINEKYYGCSFDGILFQSPMKETVVNNVNHIVHLMGAENRLIYYLNKADYIVRCAIFDYKAFHHHEIKVFHNLHSKWVDLNGELKPLEYYQKIHKEQKNKSNEQKIVGAGVPFLEGIVRFI